ncbi:KpsF/GutQ family sugar-phosphate isomerase [Thalassotalea ponticola]|uniref:KpsF/GutQ family sugar-phosphate isomerase n=1 Tax=Thalassotalea ponticola TaxID=1523392 RepID=UPI0025B3655C|nr:KpsF/GutQ family sugar-phosphate isomerase [Thalassotalea ponticola]MDN3653518.1 KpsF/GutQ family sugar-phosphate isomerase [Thalassotalea ponticola]
MPTANQFIEIASEVIAIEREAISNLTRYVDEHFARACQLMYECTGRVIVIGMGKSGHVGGKIAATLASTGTPAFFVHPGEASHGDLGMVTSADVVLAISNSGETSELLAIIPIIKRIGAHLIGMSGNTQSTLATLSDVHICIKVPREACPLGLAPTSSTTATLVMGDALAVALLNARGFTADDFALSHPGGSLGRRLLLRLDDVMHSGDLLPKINYQCKIKDALVEMTQKGLGMTTVVDDHGTLVGLFTDGDLRRILDAQLDFHQVSIHEVMTKHPVVAKQGMLAAEGLKLMEDNSINGLVVVNDQQQPIGAMNMHDLLKAGVL